MTMTLTVSPSDILAKSKPGHRALTARIAQPGETPWQLVLQPAAPALQPGQVLIRTTHVALNPFDWQGVAFRYGISTEAKVMGRDGAGVVVGVGRGVSGFQKGDRVWFCADSSRSGTGAFQEYSVHAACSVGLTPPNVTDEQAATLGTGLITAGVALFRTLGLSLENLISPAPTKDSWILIWGGSGITGVYLIQLARRLGYKVICAASPSNHIYVSSLGASVVLDRWGEPSKLVEQARQVTGDNVTIAIDNVGKQTAALCHEILRGSTAWRKAHDLAVPEDPERGKLVPLAGFDSPADHQDDTLRQVDNLRISFSTTFYAQPDFSRTLLDAYGSLLESGAIQPARIRYIDGGLDGIERGLEDLRNGRVPGGYKLVARLADTSAW